MRMRLQPLDRQVVVITGASSGIGLATAAAAAAYGASVVLAARSAETLSLIADEIGRHGGRAVAVPADVSKREDVERIAQVAMERFGRVDTWVNDASVSIYGRLTEVSDEDARRIMDVNFWGVWHGSRVAVPLLARQGGALINVGSEVSDTWVPLQGIYAATKHAVKGFTEALRLEIEDIGNPVSVTLIQPTAVDTPFPDHAKNLMSAQPKLPTPMIAPERVADAILDAATTPRRDVRVGAGASFNVMTARMAPLFADVGMKLQIGRQQRAEPPADPLGALERPSEATLAGAGAIHGRGNRNATKGREKKAIVERDRERSRSRVEHAAASGGASVGPSGGASVGASRTGASGEGSRG